MSYHALVEKQRLDFPFLKTTPQDKPLIYFDNAASTQKPISVIHTLKDFYCTQYSNVHRGTYELSERATYLFEKVRQKVQTFINAKYQEEIVFTRGTTEAINLVANSYGKSQIKANDEIVISYMEHHSNILPWQQLCQETGALLKIIPVNALGELCLETAQKLLSKKTKLMAITHLSNVLGTVNPVKPFIAFAHENNVPVLLDGAQAIAHLKVDVQSLDCDFYTFSGHKMYGPTGIGILYGKKKHLDNMPPWQVGGGMIEAVNFEKTTYQAPPYRFEAGTPAIAEAIGLGAALDYLMTIDLSTLLQLEDEVTQYARKRLKELSFVKVLGSPQQHKAVLSFTVENLHAHDVATLLAAQGIATRAGHHCNMPLMDALNIPAVTRVSFALYNTKQEVDLFIQALKKGQKLLS